MAIATAHENPPSGFFLAEYEATFGGGGFTACAECTDERRNPGWVMQKSEEIFANLDIAVLLEWFSTLNVRTIYNNSRLLALACWAYLLTHQREQAGLLLNEIERQNQLRDFELLALKAR